MDETTPVHVEDAMHALTYMASYKKGDETTERQVAATRNRRTTYLPKD